MPGRWKSSPQQEGEARAEERGAEMEREVESHGEQDIEREADTE